MRVASARYISVRLRAARRALLNAVALCLAAGRTIRVLWRCRIAQRCRRALGSPTRLAFCWRLAGWRGGDAGAPRPIFLPALVFAASLPCAPRWWLSRITAIAHLCAGWVCAYLRSSNASSAWHGGSGRRGCGADAHCVSSRDSIKWTLVLRSVTTASSLAAPRSGSSLARIRHARRHCAYAYIRDDCVAAVRL